MVLLPGPVLLLEGKADLFKVPAQLGSATQEGTLACWPPLDGAPARCELGIDAAWELARVLEIAAGTEAFFDFDRPDAWHLWIGQYDAGSARIRADFSRCSTPTLADARRRRRRQRPGGELGR